MTMPRSIALVLSVLALLCCAAEVSASDHSGFWKENCDDPYGLQVKRYEDRYTVTFCGPGGCGTPDPALATPIEGDKEYEILGPDKIKIIYSAGYTPIYTKCTTETHPVLEYSVADRAEERRNIAITTVFHAVYLVVAAFIYIFVHRRTAQLPPNRKRVIRSLVAASMFSPGIYLTWPFANPTFALLAFAFSLSTLVLGASSLFYFATQALYALTPILVVWGVLYIASHVFSKLRHKGTPPHGA